MGVHFRFYLDIDMWGGSGRNGESSLKVGRSISKRMHFLKKNFLGLCLKERIQDLESTLQHVALWSNQLLLLNMITTRILFFNLLSFLTCSWTFGNLRSAAFERKFNPISHLIVS